MLSLPITTGLSVYGLDSCLFQSGLIPPWKHLSYSSESRGNLEFISLSQVKVEGIYSSDSLCQSSTV